MRAVYKNPKELAMSLKDLIDSHLEDLISYEKLEEKALKIVEKNTVYRNGFLDVKIANVLGDLRIEILNKIVLDNQKEV